MASWYPGASSYREFAQANTFVEDITNAIEAHSSQLSNSVQKYIKEHQAALSDQTKQIVASNSQIKSTIENGFNHMAEISQRGFDNVSSAVEAMHSDLNYNFGLLIQRVELQNRLFTKLIEVLQAPFETKVIEYYNKGCTFLVQGFLEGAIKCFETSISINEMGTYFFPSHYELGRIYLTGVTEEINVIDLSKATEYLLRANEFGSRVIKSDQSFKPYLADCKYYLSLAYYRQLTGNWSTVTDQEILKNALKYCNEAVLLNPRLSQGYYHLAKYNSYQNDDTNMISNLTKAILIDRRYLLDIGEDRIFKNADNSLKKSIIELFVILTNRLRITVEPELMRANNYIAEFQSKGVSQFQNLMPGFTALKNQVRIANEEFQTQTYFGYDDCRRKLEKLLNAEYGELLKFSKELNAAKGQKKVEDAYDEKKRLKRHKHGVQSGIMGLVLGAVGGFIAALVLFGAVKIHQPFASVILILLVVIPGIIGWKYGYKDGSNSISANY